MEDFVNDINEIVEQAKENGRKEAISRLKLCEYNGEHRPIFEAGIRQGKLEERQNLKKMIENWVDRLADILYDEAYVKLEKQQREAFATQSSGTRRDQEKEHGKHKVR